MWIFFASFLDVKLENGLVQVKDYRYNPEKSPFAWCPQCKRLLPVESGVKVMKTVFRIVPSGVYPYGTFPSGIRRVQGKIKSDDSQQSACQD
jgi:hypothetical protein